VSSGGDISSGEPNSSASREFNGKEGTRQEQNMGFLYRQYL
jgi:hypothetical protein